MGTFSEQIDIDGKPVDALTVKSNKDAALDFLTLVSTGHVRQAFSTYVAKQFKHHNPFFEAGAVALMNAMDDNARQHPEKQLTPHHVIAEGSLVAVHGHVRHSPKEIGFALVTVFRFAGGKIVELWDLGQEVPSASPNTDGMF